MCLVTFSKISNSCFVRGSFNGTKVTTPTSTSGLGRKAFPSGINKKQKQKKVKLIYSQWNQK